MPPGFVPAASPPGHLDLSGAPLALQVVTADHTDGLPAVVDGVCDVLYDGLTCGDTLTVDIEPGKGETLN